MRDLRRERPQGLTRVVVRSQPTHAVTTRLPALARKTPRIERSAISVARNIEVNWVAVRTPAPHGRPPDRPDEFPEDAYLDYRRSLTAEGGVLIVYKDLDLRLRHTLWRVAAAMTATALAGVLITYAPVQSLWIKGAALLVTAVINWVIVRRPVELYRSIEIRPDCMILDGTDIFWLGMMEEGWPAFFEDDKGNQILCGTYGTRFVEYLTVRSFEEEDRTPEVFATHLQDAMKQLWGAALMHGTLEVGSRGRP